MKGVAGKDGMGGPAVILTPGAVKGVEEYPAAVGTMLRAPVLAGVTPPGLITGVTRWVPIALM